MGQQLALALTALAVGAVWALGACSHKPAAHGKIVVAVTVDWEGAFFNPDGLDALDELRKNLDDVPLTHFVCAAYLTKEHPDPKGAVALTEAVRKTDEVGMHLHAWKSLVRASGVEPKLSPSFLTGTDKLEEFEDGDLGYDTDLDVYSVVELRDMLRTSRRLFEQAHVAVGQTFRAGGYLGTPKVLEAIADEGYTVDSSATDWRAVKAGKDAFLPKRIHEVWPNVDASTAPFLVEDGRVLEMPIAASADYASAADVTAVFDAAKARLTADPSHDVFVVVGFDMETAQEMAPHVGDALVAVRKRADLAPDLVFTTVGGAAARVKR